MKKIIVSLIVMSFLFPIMSANASSPAIDIGKPIPPEPWPPTSCFISQGEKTCTSCTKGPSAGSIDVNRRTGVRTEISKTCEKCTTTIEPLVRRKACKKDSDCVLVKPNCCSGPCEPIAVHKFQEGNYLTRLEKECQPPHVWADKYKREDGVGDYYPAQCMCGTMDPPPKYKAICYHFPPTVREHVNSKRRPRSRCIVSGGGGVMSGPSLPPGPSGSLQ